MIAAGHPPEAAWRYTPRQMSAFLFIANRRRRRELKEALAVHRLAAHGSPKDLQKFIKADE